MRDTSKLDNGGVSPSGRGSVVVDNTEKSRFELSAGGETAVLLYERTVDALRLIHTEVPVALRGQHLGEALVQTALDAAHAAGLRVVAICPFVKAYMHRHPGRIEVAHDTTHDG